MKRLRHRWPCLLVALAALASPAAAASLQAWLFVDETVPGESVDAGHPEWLDVETASATGDTPFTDTSISLRRRIDKASPLLMKACATNQVFPEMRLHLAESVEGESRLFWALTLTDVRVRSCKNSGDGGTAGNPPLEEIELAYQGVRLTYYQLSEPGAPPVTTALPYTGDADGDGMSDAFETQFALLLHSDDAAQDADGDGLTNLEEFQVGTDPRSGASIFKATVQPGPPGSTDLMLNWNSVAGASYRVRHTPNLGQPFEVIATVTATGPTCSHTVARSGPMGFYKVEIVTP